MDGGASSNQTPVDATTYYYGWGEGLVVGGRTTMATVQMTIPKSGRITRVIWSVVIGTNGSNESVQHYLRLNNTTDTTLSTTETYDPGANTTKTFNYSAFTPIVVVAGDTIALKIICPTWATNPSLTGHLAILIET
jgi:hypothetical protein